MKKIINWIGMKSLTSLAGLALIATATISNRVCAMHFHQDKLPESAKKLRKF